MPNPATTVLWRLFNQRREHSRAVILPGGPPHTLAFFIDDRLDRAENYDTMELAVFRADDVKRTMIEDGWMEDA
jgi:hypothetical protein